MNPRRTPVEGSDHSVSNSLSDPPSLNELIGELERKRGELSQKHEKWLSKLAGEQDRCSNSWTFREAELFEHKARETIEQILREIA